MPQTNLAQAAINNCTLSLSGANLLLSQGSGGGQVNIGGIFYPIPASGPTLGPGGLSASTTYFIYAFINSGAIALEASTTGYVQNGTYGNLSVKSSDSSRTLVGMARTNGSTAWVDSTSQRFVRSYYNDTGLQVSGFFSANRSTSSSSVVELNSEIRCEALFWGDEIVQAQGSGEWSNVTATNNCTTVIGLDGVSTQLGTSHMIQPVSNGGNGMPCAVAGVGNIASNGGVGYHYVTLGGISQNSSSITWAANFRLNVTTSGRRGY